MDEQTRVRNWHLFELDRALRLIRLGADRQTCISHGRLVLMWLQLYDRIDD